MILPWYAYLRNPEPNLLEDVSWMLFRPLGILSIQCSLTSCDIGIFGFDPWGSLEDLPEYVKGKEDWNTNVSGEEGC